MKIAMIVCWEGNLPDYFKLWEYSCSKNAEYDFLIFTDHPQKSQYKNIKFIKFSLGDFNNVASKKLKMNINVKRPYKLCDFRPAYGIIFEDYLKKYDFWGHCDIDQIFGNIKKFITNEMLKKYDKINKNGHFVLYKNTYKMNELFTKDGGLFNYSEVFNSDENYAFDEYTGINMIVKKQNVNCIYINDFADIDKGSKRYICKNHPNYRYQFYEYDNGRVLKVYYDNGLKNQEMMYLHFQKKKLKINNIRFEKSIAIGYKKCCNIEENNNFTKEMIKSINGSKNNFMDFFEKIYYYICKVKEFFLSSRERKKIWLKQKKSLEEYK